MLRRIFVRFWFAVFGLIAACRPSPSELRFEGHALGTTYHIRIQGKGQKITRREIEDTIARLNRSLSTYISTSLISAINRGEKVKADIHFRRVFETAGKVFGESGGYFDPTVGILVNAWGFGPGPKIRGIEKDSALIDSLLGYVGWEMVTLDSAGIVHKKHPQIFIDFNSIAKGYVIDRIGDLIHSKGYENFLVELGGEVLARGRNMLEQRPWLVAIDYPQPGSRRLIAGVVLEDEAIATSGNYRKYRIDPQTGHKYVHTLNPFTGYPEPSNLLSASVIASDCTTADAWATACMAAGYRKAKEFIRTHPQLEGILIYADSTGKLRIWKSAGIKLEKLD